MFLQSVTHGVTVILFILFIIDGFPFFLKLIVSVVLVASHFGTIHAFYGLAFERSESTVEGLRSDYAHTWYLLSFFIVFAMLGRHLAYIKKSCFLCVFTHPHCVLKGTFTNPPAILQHASQIRGKAQGDDFSDALD